MNLDLIRAVDSSNMWDKLGGFCRRWRGAVDLTRSVKLKLETERIQHVIITGMGGSAIGGDLMRGYLLDCAKIPVIMNKDYQLPEYVNRHSLVIAISYSGDTEETLEAVGMALDKQAQVVAISSGGKLSQMERELDGNLIKIPGGEQPRFALSYIFVSLWRVFQQLNSCEMNEQTLLDTADFLDSEIEIFSNLDDNPPLELAREIEDTIPIIYSSGGAMEAVNYRWRSQINETAKTLSYGSVFPEMNHNEIVGWERTAHLMGKVSCVLLTDSGNHSRIQARMDVTEQLLEPHAVAFKRVNSIGDDLLQRIFYLVLFGDYTAFYLAILSETDPTPIPKIDLLKIRLSELD